MAVVLYKLINLFLVGEEIAGLLSQLYSKGGKRNSSPAGVEQGQPQILLEFLDLAGYCRLADIQPGGRLRDAPGPGHIIKQSQGMNVHKYPFFHNLNICNT
ncbi:hypothetical protein D3C74_407150 [compost metagenome]